MTFDPTDPAGEYARQVTLHYLCSFMHDYLLLLGFEHRQRQLPGRRYRSRRRRRHCLRWSAARDRQYDVNGRRGEPSPERWPGHGHQSTHRFRLSVIFHEYIYGLTTLRLVGGPENDATLEAVQSSGMGEGWSDDVVCMLNNRLVIGSWVINNPAGLRRRPYDENYPGHFGHVGRSVTDGAGTLTYGEVHDIGEIWCSALIELNRQIGSVMAMQIVVDALKMTPANPTFIQARDAILAALTHKAATENWTQDDFEIRRLKAWRAFAKFGMGLMAKVGSAYQYQGIIADFTVPPYPATIYAITAAMLNPVTKKSTLPGDLLWYRHDGRGMGGRGWTTVKSRVGNGWDFAQFSVPARRDLCHHRSESPSNRAAPPEVIFCGTGTMDGAMVTRLDGHQNARCRARCGTSTTSSPQATG